jgi:hypothetical protein
VRISLVIVLLAAITAGMVHLRRAETRAHHRVHRLQVEQIHLRRKLYDQQSDLGRLTAPKRVRQRAKRLNVRLINRLEGSRTLAEGAADRR